MVINVYTYYEQREALKRAAKAAARHRRSQPRVRPVATGPRWHQTWACRVCLLGMLVGELLWFFQLRQIPPAVIIVLLGAWGILLGAGLDWTFGRVRKFIRALRGDRLDDSDLRALRGRK